MKWFIVLVLLTFVSIPEVLYSMWSYINSITYVNLYSRADHGNARHASLTTLHNLWTAVVLKFTKS